LYLDLLFRLLALEDNNSYMDMNPPVFGEVMAKHVMTVVIQMAPVNIEDIVIMEGPLQILIVKITVIQTVLH
jgi:hypothetical protein